MLEDRPPQIRKTIALIITIGVGVILLLVMVITYATHTTTTSNTETGSKLKHFYTTIVTSGQSYFGGK